MNFNPYKGNISKQKGMVCHMKKLTKLLLIIGLALMLAACGSKEGTVTEENYEALEEGMTKADVKELLGEPLEDNDNQWIYDLTKEDRTLTLNIFFNGEDLAGSTTSSKKE